MQSRPPQFERREAPDEELLVPLCSRRENNLGGNIYDHPDDQCDAIDDIDDDQFDVNDDIDD